MKRASGKTNLSIVKDYLDGVRPFVQVSMTGVYELQNRKEGEEWIDDSGKKWKKKNGVKISVNKNSTLINEERCKICHCDVRWGSNEDRRVWPKTQKCYDCFIEFETLLKVKGFHSSYERCRDLKNLKGHLNELKAKLTETINWCNDDKNKKINFFNDDGSTQVETWNDSTGAVEKIKNDALADLVLVVARLSDVKTELDGLDDNSKSVKIVENSLIKKYKNGRTESARTIEVLNN